MKLPALSLLLASCATVSVPPPDAAAPPPDAAAVSDFNPKRCQQPQDVGNVVWWDGDRHLTTYPLFDSIKYTCKDHGPDHHGLWFEAGRD